jgi:hypothetical protein
MYISIRGVSLSSSSCFAKVYDRVVAYRVVLFIFINYLLLSVINYIL